MKLTNFSGSAIAAILSTTILAGGYGTMAYAQDDTSRLGGFEDEVIVTARKRQETVQDIPVAITAFTGCLLYTSPSPRDQRGSRMPSSA